MAVSWLGNAEIFSWRGFISYGVRRVEGVRVK